MESKRHSIRHGNTVSSTGIGNCRPKKNFVRFQSPSKTSRMTSTHNVPCPRIKPPTPTSSNINHTVQVKSLHEESSNKLELSSDSSEDFTNEFDKVNHNVANHMTLLKPNSVMEKLYFRGKVDDSASILEARRRETSQLYSLIEALSHDENACNYAYIQLMIQNQIKSSEKQSKTSKEKHLAALSSSKSTSKGKNKLPNKIGLAKPETDLSKDSNFNLYSLAKYYQQRDDGLPLEHLMQLQKSCQNNLKDLLKIKKPVSQSPILTGPNLNKDNKSKPKANFSKKQNHGPKMAIALSAPYQISANRLVQPDLISSPSKVSNVSNAKEIEENPKSLKNSQNNIKMETVLAEPESPVLSMLTIPGVAILPKQKKISFGSQCFVQVKHKDAASSEVEEIDNNPETELKDKEIKPNVISNTSPKQIKPSELLDKKINVGIAARKSLEEMLCNRIYEHMKLKDQESGTNSQMNSSELNITAEEILNDVLDSIIMQKIPEIVAEIQFSVQEVQILDIFHLILDEIIYDTILQEKQNFFGLKNTSVIYTVSQIESSNVTSPDLSDVLLDKTENEDSISASSMDSHCNRFKIPKTICVDAETQVSEIDDAKVVHVDAETQMSEKSNFVAAYKNPPIPTPSERQPISPLSVNEHSSAMNSLKEIKEIEADVESECSPTKYSVTFSTESDSNSDSQKTILSASIDDSLSDSDTIVQIIRNAGQHNSELNSFSGIQEKISQYIGWKNVLSDASFSEGEVIPIGKNMKTYKQESLLSSQEDLSIGEVKPNVQKKWRRNLHKQSQ